MPDEEKKLSPETEDIFAGIEKAPTPLSSPVSRAEPSPEVPEPKKKVNIGKIIRPIVIIIIIAALGLIVWFALPKIKSFWQTWQEKKVEVSTSEPDELSPTILPVPAPVTELAEIPGPAVLDSDNDGLFDKEEDELGTNKNNPDSDNDGLFDKEEVKIYLTDPLEPDTDADGILDGQEVKQGKDPNDPDPEAILLDIQREINKLNQ